MNFNFIMGVLWIIMSILNFWLSTKDISTKTKREWYELGAKSCSQVGYNPAMETFDSVYK